MKTSSGLGKLPKEFMERVVFRNLGKRSRLVRGPGNGLDNSIISVGGGKVMVVTSDPVSIIPAIGMQASAWLSVHHLASDYTTSGLMPRFAVFDYNLPRGLGLDDLQSYLEAAGRECERLGVSIVGGHTGRYPGCDYTIVGGGMLFGFAGEREYVTPAMAGEGDRILVTKGAAIGTTAVLANAFPGKLGEKLDSRTLRRARALLSKCSTVGEARVAASIGLRDGVTSMHDATEGGLLGALCEVSAACGRAITVDVNQAVVSEEARAVCSFFGLDPLTSGSEGSLIITVRPEEEEPLRAKLREEGIESFSVGEVGGRERAGLWVGRRRFVPPEQDAYWDAYANAVREGWK